MRVTNLTKFLIFCTLGLPPMANAQEKPKSSRLPEGPGLAAKYPGDRGIEKDPQIVFAEDFEAPSLDAIKKRFKENERIARYVGDGFAAQLEKALLEVGGKKFLSQNAREKEELKHVHSHGHDEREHLRIVSPSLRRSK